MKLTTPELAAKVLTYFQTVEDAKSEYDRADELLLEIAQNWRKSRKKLKVEGVNYEIVNQFAEPATKLWGHGSVRKWDIRPVKKGKAA